MAHPSKAEEKKSAVGAALDPLLSTDEELRGALRERRSDYLYESIHPTDQDTYLSRGWELERAGKATTRVRRRKIADKKLEDRVWCLMAKMGYPKDNRGEAALIEITEEKPAISLKIQANTNPQYPPNASVLMRLSDDNENIIALRDWMEANPW